MNTWHRTCCSIKISCFLEKSILQIFQKAMTEMFSFCGKPFYKIGKNTHHKCSVQFCATPAGCAVCVSTGICLFFLLSAAAFSLPLYTTQYRTTLNYRSSYFTQREGRNHEFLYSQYQYRRTPWCPCVGFTYTENRYFCLIPLRVARQKTKNQS